MSSVVDRTTTTPFPVRETRLVRWMRTILHIESVFWWMFVATLVVHVSESPTTQHLLWFNVCTTLPLTWLAGVVTLRRHSTRWLMAYVVAEASAVAANVVQIAVRGRDFGECSRTYRVVNALNVAARVHAERHSDDNSTTIDVIPTEPTPLCKLYPEHQLTIVLVVMVALVVTVHVLGGVVGGLLWRGGSVFIDSLDVGGGGGGLMQFSVRTVPGAASVMELEGGGDDDDHSMSSTPSSCAASLRPRRSAGGHGTGGARHEDDDPRERAPRRGYSRSRAGAPHREHVRDTRSIGSGGIRGLFEATRD